MILEYPWSSRMLGAAVVVVFAWMLWRCFREDGRSALVFPPFELAGLALTAHWWLTQIRVGPEHLEVRSPWRECDTFHGIPAAFCRVG